MKPQMNSKTRTFHEIMLLQYLRAQNHIEEYIKTSKINRPVTYLSHAIFFALQIIDISVITQGFRHIYSEKYITCGTFEHMVQNNIYFALY